jgi:hypothetical protein
VTPAQSAAMDAVLLLGHAAEHRIRARECRAASRKLRSRRDPEHFRWLVESGKHVLCARELERECNEALKREARESSAERKEFGP